MKKDKQLNLPWTMDTLNKKITETFSKPTWRQDNNNMNVNFIFWFWNPHQYIATCYMVRKYVSRQQQKKTYKRCQRSNIKLRYRLVKNFRCRCRELINEIRYWQSVYFSHSNFETFRSSEVPSNSKTQHTKTSFFYIYGLCWWSLATFAWCWAFGSNVTIGGEWNAWYSAGLVDCTGTSECLIGLAFHPSFLICWSELDAGDCGEYGWW